MYFMDAIHDVQLNILFFSLHIYRDMSSRGSVEIISLLYLSLPSTIDGMSLDRGLDDLCLYQPIIY